MFIRKTEYDVLILHQRLCEQLENEVQRLSRIISAEVQDCKMGVWCKDCVHLGSDRSVVTETSVFMGGEYVVAERGKVNYCKKHLHEICPEFVSNREVRDGC